MFSLVRIMTLSYLVVVVSNKDGIGISSIPKKAINQTADIQLQILCFRCTHNVAHHGGRNLK